MQQKKKIRKKIYMKITLYSLISKYFPRMYINILFLNFDSAQNLIILSYSVPFDLYMQSLCNTAIKQKIIKF